MRVGEMQWCAGMLGLFLFAAACDEKSSAEPDSNDSSGSSARSSRRSSTSSSSTSSDKDDQDAGSSSKSSTGKLAVSIEFAARVGSEDFACGEEYKKVGSSKTTVTPRDLLRADEHRFTVRMVRPGSERNAAARHQTVSPSPPLRPSVTAWCSCQRIQPPYPITRARRRPIQAKR